jgi:hypothetical protein
MYVFDLVVGLKQTEILMELGMFYCDTSHLMLMISVDTLVGCHHWGFTPEWQAPSKGLVPLNNYRRTCLLANNKFVN